jgi:hypothetical protein
VKEGSKTPNQKRENKNETETNKRIIKKQETRNKEQQK